MMRIPIIQILFCTSITERITGNVQYLDGPTIQYKKKACLSTDVFATKLRNLKRSDRKGKGAPCIVRLNKFEYVQGRSVYGEPYVGGVGSGGVCLVDLHVGRGGSFNGEFLCVPVNRITERQDWKHYFPTTLLTSSNNHNIAWNSKAHSLIAKTQFRIVFSKVFLRFTDACRARGCVDVSDLSRFVSMKHVLVILTTWITERLCRNNNHCVCRPDYCFNLQS